MGEIREAVRTGLVKKGHGAVQNGPTLRTSARRLVEKATRHSDIVVARPPVGLWSCDTCSDFGSGWAEMRVHYDSTYHMVYTAIEEAES